MSLRSLIRTRRHPRPATRYVDRHVIGTPDELGVLIELATERGPSSSPRYPYRYPTTPPDSAAICGFVPRSTADRTGRRLAANAGPADLHQPY